MALHCNLAETTRRVVCLFASSLNLPAVTSQSCYSTISRDKHREDQESIPEDSTISRDENREIQESVPENSTTSRFKHRDHCSWEEPPGSNPRHSQNFACNAFTYVRYDYPHYFLNLHSVLNIKKNQKFIFAVFLQN